MGRLARIWGLRQQLLPGQTPEYGRSLGGYPEGGRLGRLELVYMHTARAGGVPMRRFLERHYGAGLRNEYNTHPPQHRFEPGEIKSWVDWVSRLVPNSGRALATNFLVQPHDVGYNLRPVRFATLIREPIARIAGEFLAFRQDIEARGDADAETRAIAGDIVRFADTMMRNDYLVRFFSCVDVCDPVASADADRARDALVRLDVVGHREAPQSFARRLLALEVLDGTVNTDVRNVFVAQMSQPFRGPGDEFAAQLDPDTRRQLETRNSHDVSIYHWIVKELAHD